MQKPSGVQISNIDGILTIVLPRLERKRLALLMAPYILMAIGAVVMIAFGIWIFGADPAKVQTEAPYLPPLFFGFLALFVALASISAAGFCVADRRVSIRADGAELAVLTEGSIGGRDFRCRRDTIVAIYADGFWLWILGPHRPKHILWQRLPEERFWVAEELARFFGVRQSAPPTPDEIEVRAILAYNDEVHPPFQPMREWLVDPREWSGNLRIERDGAILTLPQGYGTQIAFRRYFGLSPREWFRWLPYTMKASTEVLPQNVEWLQRNGQDCLQVAFVPFDDESRRKLTLILWHRDGRNLEQLYQMLTRSLHRS